MPHVSKKELSEEESKELFRYLVAVLDSLNTRKKKSSFLWSFLTPTEKIMLSKRLAVIMLLHKGASHYEIWTRLGMSPSTIMRIAVLYDRGKYNDLVRLLNREAPDFFEIVDLVLRGGGIMPRYVGRRWRH